MNKVERDPFQYQYNIIKFSNLHTQTHTYPLSRLIHADIVPLYLLNKGLNCILFSIFVCTIFPSTTSNKNYILKTSPSEECDLVVHVQFANLQCQPMWYLCRPTDHG